MITCSVRSLEVGEPVGATAQVARAFVALEQPGPWGSYAFTESHLDAALGAELDRRARRHGARLLLIRRPGPHPNYETGEPRQVLLAYDMPGASWLERVTVDDPKALLELDFAALTAGERPLLGQAVSQPVLLVCTNGRRDRCCAVLGRPLAAALAPHAADRLWETTHIGGHRFAPTALLLPHGVAYGRLSPVDGEQLLDAADVGEVVLDAYRGRATWTQPEQAAEIAVRRHVGERGLDALTVGGSVRLARGDDETWRVEVTHRDGRRWSVTVYRRLDLPARPESCVKAASRPESYVWGRIHAH